MVCHVPPPTTLRHTGSPAFIFPELTGARKSTGFPVGVQGTTSTMCSGSFFAIPPFVYQNPSFHGGLSVKRYTTQVWQTSPCAQQDCHMMLYSLSVSGVGICFSYHSRFGELLQSTCPFVCRKPSITKPNNTTPQRNVIRVLFISILLVIE